MAIDCEVCQELRDTSNIFTLFGITEELCNSLKNNTGLNPDLAVAHDNCTDLTNMIDCLIGRMKEEINIYDPCDYRPMIEILLNNLYTVMTALKCSDCGQWDNIDDLWEQIRLIWIEIKKIWDSINSIVNTQYTNLTYGTDYMIYTYNGFHFQEQPGYLNVQISTTLNITRVRFGTSTSVPIRNLQHDTIDETEFRHGNTFDEVPKSHVLRIEFINNYAYLNNPTNGFTTEGDIGGIWNTYPKGERASWMVLCSAHRNTSRGTGYTLACTSISDGYNTQYAERYETPLEGRYLNLSGELALIY